MPQFPYLTWDAFLSYATLVLATIITVAALFKDAKDYVNASRTRGKLLLFVAYVSVILLFLGGLSQTHINRKQAIGDKQQAEQAQHKLEEGQQRFLSAESESKAHLEDASASLQKLQDKVDKLQTQAQTQKLSLELADVSRELEDAKAKLQKPLAKFEPTFATTDYTKLPIQEAAGERTPQGIKANFGVLNSSDIAAVKGEIAIRLCNGCQYGSEPEGFAKLKVGPDDERVRTFERILEHTVEQDMSITIIPPFALDTRKLVFAVMVKCENCEPSKYKSLVVDVPPLIPPDFTVKKKRAKPKP
jgi:hypothetical protein